MICLIDEYFRQRIRYINYYNFELYFLLLLKKIFILLIKFEFIIFLFNKILIYKFLFVVSFDALF